MRDRDPVIEAYSASARELAERYETLAGKSPTNLVHRRYRTDVRFRGQRRACRTAETEALCRPAVLPKAVWRLVGRPRTGRRSEEHTSELQSLMRISYAVFCLKKKKHLLKHNTQIHSTQRTNTQKKH